MCCNRCRNFWSQQDYHTLTTVFDLYYCLTLIPLTKIAETKIHLSIELIKYSKQHACRALNSSIL